MIERLVSGGQTGVDRAGLDVALALGIPCGGWCPRGRRAEDGAIPARYPQEETASADYQERTELNVLDSDGTLIIAAGPLTGGSALTRRIAELRGKPCIVADLDAPPDRERIRRWLSEHRIGVLNVAGPRESLKPGIGERARNFLSGLLDPEP